MAGAVTTVTPSWARGQNVRKIQCHWLCDAATAEPLDAVTPEFGGWIERVTYKITGGATTPPTDNVLHLVISDEDGAVLNTGTQLDNLSNTGTNHWIPDNPIYVAGAATIRVQNNVANAAQFDVYIYVAK